MSEEGASYRDAGVDYDALDAAKRLAMLGALSTSALLGARGGRALDASRGEPAFVFELGERTLALVLEGLGTKSMIARAVLEQQGVNRFAEVAYDTVAAILNDLCCVGALPLVVNAYFATGDLALVCSTGTAPTALLEGWRRACEDAGCAWGGGESPSLARDALRAGHRARRRRRRRASPTVSSRSSAASCAPATRSCCSPRAACTPTAPRWRAWSPSGCRTASRRRSPTAAASGRRCSSPSVMYVPLVAALLEQGVAVSYLSHITGHGLLKLMRPSASFTYRIAALPDVPPVLSFLVDEAGIDPAEAYSTFNMGVGFAVYCAPGESEAVLGVAPSWASERCSGVASRRVPGG